MHLEADQSFQFWARGRACEVQETEGATRDAGRVATDFGRRVRRKVVDKFARLISDNIMVRAFRRSIFPPEADSVTRIYNSKMASSIRPS